jgi:periplasmic divalent cation tolerance protein
LLNESENALFIAMKSTAKYVVVLVTTPDLKTARKLAKAALKARLVACANLIPKIESHYWWQNKLEASAEVLLLLKTTRARLAALEKSILANHPYDTPEFIVLTLSSGNQRYLDWLAESVG